MFSKYRRINRSFTSTKGHTFQNDHTVSLLYVLKDHLLRHAFAPSAAVMKSLAYVMDMIPSIYRRVGIEVLSHRPEDYGRCLQFMKHIFNVHQSTSRVREEILLEMCFFIASHGNLAESYDVMTSHVNTDPFKSNPLIVGYCGLMAYLLWKEEMNKKENEEEMFAGGTSAGLDHLSSQCEVTETQAESSRGAVMKLASDALIYFEQLSSMMHQHDCCVAMFVLKHAELLEKLGRPTEALTVLLHYQQTHSKEINANRYVCDHLRIYCTANVELRIHHLTVLVQLDESCPEVIELLELVLYRDGSVTHINDHFQKMFEILIKFLDYPCNGANPQGWGLLHHIQSCWPDYSSNELWMSRLNWWRKLYPHMFQ